MVKTDNRFAPLSDLDVVENHNVAVRLEENAKGKLYVPKNRTKNVKSSSKTPTFHSMTSMSVDRGKTMGVVKRNADDKYDMGILFLTDKNKKLNRAKQADFNRKFVKQNKGCFGFIPLSRMPEKVSDKSVNHDLDYVEIHKKLRKDGRKNFEGLQLPIKSKLNYDKFAHYLRNYWDWQLPMFTKFGFPLDLDANVPLESDLINHPSAVNFPEHINHYIAEEQSHDGLLGPFDTPPFPINTSPFMSREKQESDKRRGIVDLS